MRRTTLLITVLIGLCWQSAFANGYDVYAAPLAWSPDGHLLAAAVNDVWPRDDTLASGALRLYGRNGEVVAELATGMVGTPSFSPDGKLLAAVVDGNLAIYDVATREMWKEELEESLTSGALLDCHWTEKPIFFSIGERFYGATVGFVDLEYPEIPIAPLLVKDPEKWAEGSTFSPIVHSEGWCIFLGQNVPQTGGAAYERMLRNTERGDIVLVAKPQSRPDDYHESNAMFLDDHTVLFQRGGWGDWQILRIDLDTQEEQLEVADAQQPALDASGTLLAYVRRDWRAKQQAEYDWDLPSTVRLRNRATGEDIAVSTPEVYAELPALSPDGERIAWLEQAANGMAQVAIRTVPGVIKHGPGIVPGDRAEN